MKLHKRGFVSNYVPFKYEVQVMSSFMFSLANFFSALPEGVEVNKDRKKLAIIPSKLKFFNSPFEDITVFVERFYGYLTLNNKRLN